MKLNTCVQWGANELKNGKFQPIIVVKINMNGVEKSIEFTADCTTPDQESALAFTKFVRELLETTADNAVEHNPPLEVNLNTEEKP